VARFYGSLTGDQAKTEATRIGHKSLIAHVRGWNLGVRIFCDKVGEDEIRIRVYRTGGSNDPTIKEFIGMVEGKE
jgi:hypothetical protein